MTGFARTLDFVADGGSSHGRYVAIRPFNVGESELDDLPIFYDVAYWSNNPDTEASRDRYNADFRPRNRIDRHRRHNTHTNPLQSKYRPSAAAHLRVNTR